MIELICDKAQSLKEFTENNCAQASFYWNRLLKDKEIKVNGKKVGADVTLQEGDVVRYYLTQKQEEKTAFYTVYEDENLLVVDKESGVNSEAVFAELYRKTGGRCAFIYRLDRNTRGLMAFALNEKTENALLSAFKEKRVEKRYHALCFGAFEKPSAVLTAYLKKDEKNALVKIYDKETAGAERIVTEYRVIESDEKTTKAELILHTGKTHQIRAHLAHIGNPIVGDMKYGDAAKNRAKNAARQCLVAKELAFEMSGELSYLNGKRFVSRFGI
ncbi:MAG: RluA family pseudouridine synthase [Clostridia bacterium]|nr:RluA family pseudouridine synthase [Clostridia bacterium]